MASVSDASGSSFVIGPMTSASDQDADQTAGPSSQVVFNRNPHGKNQHKDCRESTHFHVVVSSCLDPFTAREDDPRIPELLAEYHRRLITNKNDISALLLAEHGIIMSYVHQRRMSITPSASDLDFW